MSDEELCKALRSALWGQGHHINSKAADRIEQLERERDEYFGISVHWRKEADVLSEQRREAHAKLAKAMEALHNLIQHTHNCEKELTEKLHHQDFCGESLPLTNARTVLAELENS